MTPIFLFLVAIFFAIPPVNALGWEIKLTGDKDYDTSHGDIFYDKQQGILVFIKSCYRSKTAILEFSDEQNKIWLIKEECEIRSVYKNVDSVSFEKKVNLIKESDDLFKIVNEDRYVRTELCVKSFFTEEEVMIKINDAPDIMGSIGQLIFEGGDRCAILGIYKKFEKYDLPIQE